MWVRGLKLTLSVGTLRTDLVAPHVGAWIETEKERKARVKAAVAPHVGAWIETNLLVSAK